MIRHDHPSMQPVAHPIEVYKCVLYHFCYSRNCQPASSNTSVHGLLDPPHPRPVPMPHSLGSQFSGPIGQDRRWQAVLQTNHHMLNGRPSLPVRNSTLVRPGILRVALHAKPVTFILAPTPRLGTSLARGKRLGGGSRYLASRLAHLPEAGLPGRRYLAVPAGYAEAPLTAPYTRRDACPSIPARSNQTAASGSGSPGRPPTLLESGRFGYRNPVNSHRSRREPPPAQCH